MIGGYLGYIGWFCVAAGFQNVSAQPINDPTTLYLLFPEEEPMRYVPKLCVFAVITAILLVVHWKWNRYVFLMPSLLLLLPVIILFCAYLILGGEQPLANGDKPGEMDPKTGYDYYLRSNGWLPPVNHELVWGYLSLRYYDPSLVYWQYLPQQILNLVGLFTVVTFGSSLDIAAIQAELPYRLDFNSEMRIIRRVNNY